MKAYRSVAVYCCDIHCYLRCRCSDRACSLLHCSQTSLIALPMMIDMGSDFALSGESGFLGHRHFWTRQDSWECLRKSHQPHPWSMKYAKVDCGASDLIQHLWTLSVHHPVCIWYEVYSFGGPNAEWQDTSRVICGLVFHKLKDNSALPFLLARCSSLVSGCSLVSPTSKLWPPIYSFVTSARPTLPFYPRPSSALSVTIRHTLRTLASCISNLFLEMHFGKSIPINRRYILICRMRLRVALDRCLESHYQTEHL
ncbi:hypothetical protein CGRA01v4_00298 [Colletotrichum graminicola]|nr:hypothetical protein CGRA01v4_00298 [Colletotrichum graminicola]